jgi:hypothetical protein
VENRIKERKKAQQEKRNNLLSIIKPPLVAPPPNLFDPFKFYSSQDFYTFRFFHFARKVIIGISIVFIGFLLYNKYLDHQLNEVYAEQHRLMDEMATKEDSFWLAREIDSKVSSYKKVLEGRDLYGDNANILLHNKVPAVTVTGLTIEKGEFTLSCNGKDTLIFAFLVHDLLSHDSISQVSITSASYDAEESAYIVVLKGVFE